VAPATLGQRNRISLVGDDLFLAPLEALALSMVLHELLTNALNCGALSTGHGRVSIEWDMDVPRAALNIRWRETGGPLLAGTVQPGAGIDLIIRTIEADLRGNVKFAFAVDGLSCELRLPLGDLSLR
jgi:two-component sensor histidine kinase